MDNDLLFEGVVNELEVAVSLAGVSGDGQIVEAAEEIGVGTPFGESPGIVADVVVEGLEGAVGFEDLVVEAFVEDVGDAGEVVDGGFEAGDGHAEGRFGAVLDMKQEVEVIRHDGILVDAGRGFDFMEFAERRFDGVASRRCAEKGGAGVAAGDFHVACKRAEVPDAGGLVHGHHIDAGALVVMPGGPVDFAAHHLGFGVKRGKRV